MILLSFNINIYIQYQPLEHDTVTNLHSPLPVSKNPLVFEPKPDKFTVPGEYRIMGLEDTPEEVFNSSCILFTILYHIERSNLFTFYKAICNSEESQFHTSDDANQA